MTAVGPSAIVTLRRMNGSFSRTEGKEVGMRLRSVQVKRALRGLTLGALAVATAASLGAQTASPSGTRTAQAPRATATREALRAGFSIDRLKRIDALLQRYVDENRVAGAVALVLRDGQPIYEKAVGWAD